MSAGATLHFVYNVDATPKAIMMDFIHRVTDPDTYPCTLCDVTYGRVFKKAEWSRFVSALPHRSKFHLRGGFRRRYPTMAGEPAPAVFVESGDGALDVLISAADFDGVDSLEALKDLLASRLESMAPAAATSAPSL